MKISHVERWIVLQHRQRLQETR